MHVFCTQGLLKGLKSFVLLISMESNTTDFLKPGLIVFNIQLNIHRVERVSNKADIVYKIFCLKPLFLFQVSFSNVITLFIGLVLLNVFTYQ